MSGSCTLSSDALNQICKNELKGSAWNLIPGAGPPLQNNLQGLTDYEKNLNDQLGTAQGKLEKSNEAWQTDITELTGKIATDLNNLIGMLTGDDSIINQMIETDIEPLKENIGYIAVLVASMIVLVLNLYV